MNEEDTEWYRLYILGPNPGPYDGDAAKEYDA